MTATFAGPITGGRYMANASGQDLAAHGYLETELFVSGRAHAYRMDGPATTDGRWSIMVDDELGPADYRTRCIVRRPERPGEFSGVVLVEWLNVSAGRDGDPDWGYLHPELMREGHAWVGVSVQAVGVVGGDPLLHSLELDGGLAGSSPQRYGTLTHPGDAYAFDIYAQVAAGVRAGGADSNGARAPDALDPLGGLHPTHIVGSGESQSAFFLSTYVNALHPLRRAHDAFLIHNRGATPPSIGARWVPRDEVEPPVHVRTDLDEPVLIFETETDLTVLGYARARQPDTDRLRTWEVAGTAHADAHLIERVYAAEYDVNMHELLGCAALLNDGPQFEVLQAGFHGLVSWMRGGPPLPSAARIEVEGADAPGARIVRDEHGNARGGVRTPLVDVPVAALSGDPVPDGGELCFLFGSTRPFSADQLAARYEDRSDYLARFSTAATSAVAGGFLLPVDAEAMIERAAARELPGLGGSSNRGHSG